MVEELEGTLCISILFRGAVVYFSFNCVAHGASPVVCEDETYFGRCDLGYSGNHCRNYCVHGGAEQEGGIGTLPVI